MTIQKDSLVLGKGFFMVNLFNSFIFYAIKNFIVKNKCVFKVYKSSTKILLFILDSILLCPVCINTKFIKNREEFLMNLVWNVLLNKL